MFSFSGDGDDWMMTSRQAGEAVRVLVVDGCWMYGVWSQDGFDGDGEYEVCVSVLMGVA